MRNALARVASVTVNHDETAEGQAENAESTAAAPRVSRDTRAPKTDATAPVEAEEATVAILDIPVAKKARRPRKAAAPETEQLLETVLDSLPQAKSTTSSRGRVSRRAGSAGQVVSAPASED